MAYSHISREQRFKIQAWLELDMPQAEMAERLGKDPSSISRELKRNSYPNGQYNGMHAHKVCRDTRKKGKRKTKKLLQDKRLRRSILTRLKKNDSPEQIAGKRKRAGREYIVHETFYQYIYTERPDLVCYLRRKKNKYRRRRGTKAREKARELAKKTWITERPDHINQRKELGHWEGDTIVGKERTTAIATHVERISGYGMADLLDHATANNLRTKTVQRFSKLPKHKRLSETYDNGKEFSEHEFIAKETGMDIYFALAYHSWERGTNENWNGLLRQFFPKGTPFANLKQKDVDKAVRNLNHRPRKRLNYLTPHEVFIKGLKP
jgi:transposase, IS30 family